MVSHISDASDVICYVNTERDIMSQSGHKVHVLARYNNIFIFG